MVPDFVIDSLNPSSTDIHVVSISSAWMFSVHRFPAVFFRHISGHPLGVQHRLRRLYGSPGLLLSIVYPFQTIVPGIGTSGRDTMGSRMSYLVATWIVVCFSRFAQFVYSTFLATWMSCTHGTSAVGVPVQSML
jgi:hypothetical protein